MVLIGLFKDYPDVPVFIGGCVERGRGSSFRRKAHAHTAKPKELERWPSLADHAGWICVRSPHRIFMRDGKRPSNLMLHELAHILTNEGHTEKWRKQFRALGGKVNGALRRQGHEPDAAVIDGPDDNYAVVDLESAKEILDWPESGLTCLIVTD